MGNGALPNGPSYRAHPRLYPLRHADAYEECRLSGVRRKERGHRRTVAFFPKPGIWRLHQMASRSLTRQRLMASVRQLRSRTEHKDPKFRMCPRIVRQVRVGFRGWNSSPTDCFGSLIRERSLRSFFCASSFCRKRKRGDRVACPDRPCLVMPKPFWPLCVI